MLITLSVIVIMFIRILRLRIAEIQESLPFHIHCLTCKQLEISETVLSEFLILIGVFQLWLSKYVSPLPD